MCSVGQQQHHLNPQALPQATELIPLGRGGAGQGQLGRAFCFNTLPGDSDASLRTTAVVEVLSGTEVRSTVRFTHFTT